jgi:hypothetical protein
MAHRSGLSVHLVWQQRLYATAATLADTHPPPPPIATKPHGLADCVWVVLTQLPPWLRMWVSMWWALTPASRGAPAHTHAPAPSDSEGAAQPAPPHIYPQ